MVEADFRALAVVVDFALAVLVFLALVFVSLVVVFLVVELVDLRVVFFVAAFADSNSNAASRVIVSTVSPSGIETLVFSCLM